MASHTPYVLRGTSCVFLVSFFVRIRSVCIYVCVCVCVYIYIYIYIYELL